MEKWNVDYEGVNFEINGIGFKNRLEKKTPKKNGYFVAFWCKDKNNKNKPFNVSESKDKLIINVWDGDKKGQFIFSKDLLIKNGIIKSVEYKGKMAIRVYPSWEHDLNKTAIKTHKWQIPYFIDFTDGFNVKKIRELYFDEIIV